MLLVSPLRAGSTGRELSEDDARMNGGTERKLGKMIKGESYMCPNSLDYLCKLKNGGPNVSLGAGHRLMENVIPKNVHTVRYSANPLRVRRRAGHEIYRWIPKPSNRALQRPDIQVDGSAEYRMGNDLGFTGGRHHPYGTRCD